MSTTISTVFTLLGTWKVKSIHVVVDSNFRFLQRSMLTKYNGCIPQRSVVRYTSGGIFLTFSLVRLQMSRVCTDGNWTANDVTGQLMTSRDSSVTIDAAAWKASVSEERLRCDTYVRGIHVTSTQLTVTQKCDVKRSHTRDGTQHLLFIVGCLFIAKVTATVIYR